MKQKDPLILLLFLALSRAGGHGQMYFWRNLWCL